MCIYLFTHMCTHMNLCMAQKPHLNLSCAGWFIAPDGLAWLGLGGNWCGGWGARSQTGRGLVSAGFAQAFWRELEGGVWRSGEGVGVGRGRGLGWTPLGPLPLGSRSILLRNIFGMKNIVEKQLIFLGHNLDIWQIGIFISNAVNPRGSIYGTRGNVDRMVLLINL